MDIPIYAEPADLVPWLGSIPDDAHMQLLQASLLVNKETRFDRYEADANRLPTAVTVRNAFRDATCQQVAFWKAAKINPLGGNLGQAPQVSSQSVDGGSVSYTNLPTAEDIKKATGELCEPARTILKLNGLGSRTPGLT